MAFHRERLAAGAGEGGAGRAFGNATLAREDARGVWVWSWLDSVRQDVRYPLRSIRRQPLFACCAIGIVALGTGAATGVFGLLDRLVIRSLPVESPERLVYFRSPSFSYPIFRRSSSACRCSTDSSAGISIAPTSTGAAAAAISSRRTSSKRRRNSFRHCA